MAKNSSTDTRFEVTADNADFIASKLLNKTKQVNFPFLFNLPFLILCCFFHILLGSG